ncbi:hypothetical protein [Mucilaginibacter jinjuensis]|uniref:Uncharacterized protein n=1 Tax=Mucilaginibacter jinjuensis TaxID=1176721 RepID=A0ABY7TFH4_9SPHI|nr:hypothetical protein [Mucilaginibacter jinjuensis]WCT14953.1 hypothetical protein PQO05_13505 [Mucilaginibacter jinjuensis]
MVDEKRNITPEQAIKILQEHGTNVTIEEVQKILDFLYKIGKLSVNQYIEIN